jgi:undecaprenyl-diphosphatase
MTLLHIALLGLVQGLAELLPVSSSAHVIVASRLMGLNPAAPEMTFLIVMLHTGTMFAVIAYFWKRWRALMMEPATRAAFFKQIVIATAATGVIGLGLKFVIEKIIFEKMLGHAHGEVEQLFKNLPMVAGALFAVGILILIAGRREKEVEKAAPLGTLGGLDLRKALRIGIVQGLCLPFRGFSRSGATISAGLLMGMRRAVAEDFSFALAVVVTPPVILLQVRRLYRATQLTAGESDAFHFAGHLAPGFIGMLFSFGAGLLALRWLSAWLEKGRWSYFGWYCLVFSGFVAGLAILGY